MNKFLPGFILTLTLLVTTPAFATDALTPTPLPNRSDAMKDLRVTNKADMTKAREDFKTRLKMIKDVKKQTIIERIEARLPEINAAQTTQMSQALVRLSSILESTVSKTATITPAPVFDQSLVATARAKIATAQQAVATQAAKDYVITLGTDETLRPAAITAITTLKTDLQATNATVIASRQATIAALKAMQAAKSNK